MPLNFILGNESLTKLCSLSTIKKLWVLTKGKFALWYLKAESCSLASGFLRTWLMPHCTGLAKYPWAFPAGLWASWLLKKGSIFGSIARNRVGVQSTFVDWVSEPNLLIPLTRSSIFLDPVTTPVLNISAFQTETARYITLRCISYNGSLPINYTFFEKDIAISPAISKNVREPAEFNLTERIDLFNVCHILLYCLKSVESLLCSGYCNWYNQGIK